MLRRVFGKIKFYFRTVNYNIVIYIKFHSLARCLHDLYRPIEAYRVIEDFQDKFPNYSSNPSHKALKKDIKEAMSSGKLYR